MPVTGSASQVGGGSATASRVGAGVGAAGGDGTVVAPLSTSGGGGPVLYDSGLRYDDPAVPYDAYLLFGGGVGATLGGDGTVTATSTGA